VFTKKFNYDSHYANTLHASYVCEDKRIESAKKSSSRTHSDGWTITGDIHEDYYVWVNAFEAVHPKYGRVWGDFEHEVYADSEEAYNLFVTNYPPEEWDYWDI